MFLWLLKFLQKVPGFLIIFIFVSCGISLIRATGGLEHQELTAYDRLFQSRPPEPTDNRIVIVGITEADIQKYQPYPFSDAVLADLIKKIKAQNPRVIGLDLIRDIPQPPGTEELDRVFKTTPNLIGAGKISSSGSSEDLEAIDFPPTLKRLHEEQIRQDKDAMIADITMPLDEDFITRKGFLHPVLLENRPDLAAIPGLGALAARKYLAFERIGATQAPDGWWMQIGKVIFYPFRGNDGGYANETDGGYQILFNWRGAAGAFKHVSVAEVMEGKVSPKLFSERIVFIGAYAPSLNDTVLTPYVKQDAPNNDPPYGVEVHAQLTSQILSAVLDNRPLIKVMPDWAEYLWIVFWVGTATVGIWGIRHRKNPFVLLLCAIVYCGVLSVVIFWAAVNAFSQAWWIPLVPAWYGVWSSTILSVTNNLAWQRVREKEENEKRLKLEIQQYKQELEEAQERILAQEYLVFLGENLGGFVHECGNVFHPFRSNLEAMRFRLNELKELLDNSDCSLPERQDFEENFTALERKIKNLENIRERGWNLLEEFLPVTLESSPYHRQKTEVSLNSFVKRCCLLVLKDKERQISLNISYIEEYDPSLSTVEIVPSEINFVLRNLITNACDALKEKEAQQLGNFNPSIKLITKKLPEKIQIIVQDNGVGINPEIETNIFKIYFTTKPPGKGTGLGLFTARNLIISRYGGNIYYQSIETEKERKTQFVVELPFLIK